MGHYNTFSFYHSTSYGSCMTVQERMVVIPRGAFQNYDKANAVAVAAEHATRPAVPDAHASCNGDMLLNEMLHCFAGTRHLLLL